MNHTQFFSALKQGNIQGAYLFYGPEEFIKASALGRVELLVDEATRDLNVQRLDAGSVDDLISACETLPFFAERRLVISKFLPVEDAAKKLIGYLPTMPDCTVLIMYCTGKVNENTKLFKYFKEIAHDVKFDTISEQEAQKWVMQTARKFGVVLSPDVSAYFIRAIGTEMQMVNQELQKVLSYVGEGGNVTKEAIDFVAIKNVEYRVFDMLDYFLAANTGEGMRALDALISDGESPIKLASFLEGRFKLMLHARLLMDQGASRAEAIKRMGGSPYAAQKAYDAARKFSQAALLAAVSDFADIGYAQMSGRCRDRDALEMALFRHMPHK